jgi:hypothetical protein
LILALVRLNVGTTMYSWGRIPLSAARYSIRRYLSHAPLGRRITGVCKPVACREESSIRWFLG